MKLIGAKDFVVRSPFVIEGIIIGLIGAALPLIAIYIIYSNLIIYVQEEFTILNDLIKFMSVKEIFAKLVPIAMILGVGLGFLGSMFTVHRHLKV